MIARLWHGWTTRQNAGPTVTFFESLNAVRAFAGSDYEQAVVPPDARALLLRFDERSVHYEMVLGPE